MPPLDTDVRHEFEFDVNCTYHKVHVSIGENLKADTVPKAEIVLRGPYVSISQTIWSWQSMICLNSKDIDYLRDVLPGLLEYAGIEWSR